MPHYRGVLHVHSTLSDGAYTPRQLRDMALALGLDFLLLCEHTKRLRPRDRPRALQACSDASDAQFLCALSIECSYQGRHVLLLGPDGLLCGAVDEEVVTSPEVARAQGGFTVWAHPAATSFWTLRPAIAADYDGWELWNRYVDGPIPSWPIAAMFRQRRSMGRPLLAFGAADFHDSQRHVLEPITEVDMPRLCSPDLLDALRAGHYRTLLNLPGNPVMSPEGETEQDGSPGSLYSRLRYQLIRTRSLAVCLARSASGKTAPVEDADE